MPLKENNKYKLSAEEEEKITQFPEEMQPLARRLTCGAHVAHLIFALSAAKQELCLRNTEGENKACLNEIAYATALRLGEEKAKVEAVFHLADVQDFDKNPFTPFDPQETQKIKFHAATCFDSRVPLEALTMAAHGDVATSSNIGGSFEDHKDWSKISVDGEEAVTYANHIKRELGKQPLYLYVGHTSCGCVNNANAKQPAAPSNEEEKVIKRMAERKAGLVAEVKDNGIRHYVEMLDDNMSMHGRNTELVASEVALALHNSKLIEGQYQKVTGQNPAGVVATALYDIKTTNVSLLNPNTGKFVQLTNLPPLLNTLNRVVPEGRWKGIPAPSCGCGSH